MLVQRQAHAKVNLTLEVLGKRADGYHEIRSVFRMLALHDTLSFEPAGDIRVSSAVPELNNPQNLAHRAALLLRQASGHAGGARIGIDKSIPIAAGLGGGSSDGAAALRGLDALWQTAIPGDELARLAAALGSDVPYFLVGGTALVTGRGEHVRPLPSLPDCAVLLVKPPLAVSTAAIYGLVTPDAYTDGAATGRLAALPPDAPPATWGLVNALQPFTCRAYPVVGDILEALARWGAAQALLCGSGPTCFGLFDAAGDAEVAARQARERGWQAWVTHFC